MRKGLLIFFLLLTFSGSPAQGEEWQIVFLEEQIADTMLLRRQLLLPKKPERSRPLPAPGRNNQRGNNNYAVAFEPYILEAARKHKLPPPLLMAMIKVESDFNPTAVSYKGCIGLAQLAPATAVELGVDPWDPRQNVHGGADYFRRMYDRYGSVEEALWAYNAGPGRVASERLPGETRQYVKDVMRYWRFYAAEGVR